VHGAALLCQCCPSVCNIDCVTYHGRLVRVTSKVITFIIGPQLSPVSAIPLNLGCLQKSLVVCWLFVISIWRCSLWWRPCGARGRCRISPPRFLAECRKRRLNQGSFVMFSCLFSLICIVCMRVHVCVFLWFILSFFPYCVFVSNSQVVGLFYIAIVYLCFVFLVFASTSACDCLACLVWLVSKMTYCVSSET